MSLIGQRIGNYEILDVIGRGGMASVYRARQLSLGRDVAFKVLARSYALDEMVRRRFEQEARAVAQLSHPNIVPVYDFGDDGESGALFIVMELITGGSLGDFQGQRLPAAEIVPAIAQIARALDYAHRQGIIHRDVKPGNILLNSDGRPMLTDFGLVRWETMPVHTETGITVGTPAYMSPEQAQGGEPDGRADVYSLAMVLYEMLAGRPAYQGNTALDIMHQIVYERVPPPRKVHASIPRGVEGVVLRGLARERKDRYATAADFAAALEKTVGGDRSAPSTGLLAATHEANGKQRAPSPASVPVEGSAPAVEAEVERAQPALLRMLKGAVRLLLVLAAVLLLVTLAGALVAANVGARLAEDVISGYDWGWSEMGGSQPKAWDEANLLAQVEPWLAANRLDLLTNRAVHVQPNSAVELAADTPYLPLRIGVRLYVVGDALQVRWESLNGVTPIVVGEIVSGGINRGLERSYARAPQALERVETKSGVLLMYFKQK